MTDQDAVPMVFARYVVVSTLQMKKIKQKIMRQYINDVVHTPEQLKFYIFLFRKESMFLILECQNST